MRKLQSRRALYRGLASSIPSGAVEHVLVRFPNGRKRRSVFFLAHERVGDRSYHIHGSLEHESALSRGVRHGYEFRWDNPGHLLNAEPYHSGLAHGVAPQWSHDGRIIGRYTMIAGTGVDLWWHERDDGFQHHVGEAVQRRDGLQHGFERWFHGDSRVYIERHYWYGLEHGIERLWNAHGWLCRGYPRFFIAGERVKRAVYLRAARHDSTLPPYVAKEDLPDRPGAVARALRIERQNHRRWQRLGGAPPTLAPLYVGLLIGGASSRMGFPKHLIQTDEGTLVERTVNLLRPYCERVCLIGAGKVPHKIRNVSRIADRRGVAGPLAGMTAAFDRHPHAAWLFVACDLPQLCLEAIEWLVAQRRIGRLATIPRLDGGEIQPLCAVYEPASRELLDWLAARPRTGPRRIAGAPGVDTPVVPTGLSFAWTNVNDRRELRAFTMPS